MAILTTCCICSCIFSIFTIFAFIVGTFMIFFSSDTREERIIEYNTAIEEWRSGNQPHNIPNYFEMEFVKMVPTSYTKEDIFQSVTLYKETMEFSTNLAKNTVSSYDTVKYTAYNVFLFQNADVTDRLYFVSPISNLNSSGKKASKSYIPIGPIEKFETIRIDSSTNNNLDSLTSEYQSTYEKHERCINEFHGSFDEDTGICHIRKRISEICIVVNLETGKPYGMRGRDFGCFENWSPIRYRIVVSEPSQKKQNSDSQTIRESNNKQEFTTQSTTNKKVSKNGGYSNSFTEETEWAPLDETQISITIRDYRDPFLKALEQTDFTLDFGWSLRKKRILGGIFLLLGSSPLILIIITFLSCCGFLTCFCRCFRSRKDKND